MRRRGGVALQPGRERRAEMASGREDGMVAGWRMTQDRRAQMACEGNERQGVLGTERLMCACASRLHADIRQRFARSRGGGVAENGVDQECDGRRLRSGEGPACSVGFMIAYNSIAPNKECKRNQRQQHRECEPPAIHNLTLACHPNRVNRCGRLVADAQPEQANVHPLTPPSHRSPVVPAAPPPPRQPLNAKSRKWM